MTDKIWVYEGTGKKFEGSIPPLKNNATSVMIHINNIPVSLELINEITFKARQPLFVYAHSTDPVLHTSIPPIYLNSLNYFPVGNKSLFVIIKDNSQRAIKIEILAESALQTRLQNQTLDVTSASNSLDDLFREDKLKEPSPVSYSSCIKEFNLDFVPFNPVPVKQKTRSFAPVRAKRASSLPTPTTPVFFKPYTRPEQLQNTQRLQASSLISSVCDTLVSNRPNYKSVKELGINTELAPVNQSEESYYQDLLNDIICRF